MTRLNLLPMDEYLFAFEKYYTQAFFPATPKQEIFAQNTGFMRKFLQNMA
jgi:hypothetical protein